MTIYSGRSEQATSEALQSLFELTRSVANATRPEDIYEAALISLRKSLGVTKSAILLLDAKKVMRFAASLELSPAYLKAVEGHSPWVLDQTDPQPVLVADVALEPSLDRLRKAIEAERIRATAFIPLVVGGRLIGKFMLYYAEPHTFTEYELLVSQTIASQVAFALDQEEHRTDTSHLDAIFSSSNTGIAETDMEGRFLMVNDRYCQIVGRSREELLGTAMLALTHPEDRERNLEAIASLGAGAKNFVIEKRYVAPDGRMVWVSNDVTAIRDQEGALTGLVAVVTDITDRRQAEEVLRRSEARYRDLVGAIGLAVYTTDAQGRITLYNEAAKQLWGQTPKIGEDFWHGAWRTIDSDGVSDVPFDQVPMAIALRENRPVRGIEILVERPDGSRANVLPHPTPLQDEDGNLIGAVNVMVDVTELRRAEEAARRSEERFRSLTEHAPVGIYVTDAEGNVLLVNQNWLDFTGLENEENALGGGWAQTLHPDDRERVMREWSEFAARGGTHQGEYRYMRPNGTVVWVSGAGTALLDGEGAVTGYIGTITDITALKQAEELKDQFLGLVSHELRTPLATIYGSSRLLRERFDRIPAEDRAELLGDVVVEAERLQRIIENLLLLTRLEATGVELEPISLPMILRRGVEKVRARSVHRTFKVEIDDDVPAVLANPTYIELVIENLLANALKYSPNTTTVDVTIHVREGKPEVTILDRGIGIQPEEAAELFEPFFRSAEARALASGVGIGLSVCKRVVEAQGGSIWGKPREGGGSEFGFSLNPAPDDQ